MANITSKTLLTAADITGEEEMYIVTPAGVDRDRKTTPNELKKAGTIDTDLPGTVWDGTYRTKTLTANTALTFSSTDRAGVLRIQQDATGGRTLSINGTALTINTAANSVTIITAKYWDSIGEYDFIVDLDVYAITGGSGDVSAPTLSSATVEDAAPTKVILTYNETLNSGSVPDVGDYDVLSGITELVITNVAIVGATVEITLSAPITEGEVITLNYGPGPDPLEDVAGNDAATLTGQAVTNNVSDGSILDSITWHSRMDPAVGITTRVAGDTFVVTAADQVAGNGTEYDMTQLVEANQPKLIASGINSLPSIEINTDKFLATGTFTNLTEPITRIIVLQIKTLPGGAIAYAAHVGSGNGCSLGFYTANKPFIFGGNVAIATTFTPVADTKYIFYMEFTGDGVNDKLYINGTAITLDSGNAGADPLAANLRIGHPITGLHTWVGDHFTYAGLLSSGDRTAVTDALKTKYGIA